MARLTAVQEVRLYETLGNIAEHLPDEYRREFYRVCRDQTLWTRPTTHTVERRARVRAQVLELAMNDWRWALAALTDVGADAVLRRWATDTGLNRIPVEKGK